MSELVPPLCSTEYVEKNINKLVLVDATWYLPSTNKDAFYEFQKIRLSNSRFLSILELRDKETNLPNMLPSAQLFSSYMENIKIIPDDHIVLYDQHGIFSAPRAFWILKMFNHPKVSIMNGGLPKWLAEGRSIIENGNYLEYLNSLKNVEYPIPSLNQNLMVDYNTIFNLVRESNNDVQIIDARPIPLYESGHIPTSINLSFDRVLKFHDNIKQYKSREEIQSLINNLEVNLNKPVINYCAIAMTACILFFAVKYVSQFDIDHIEPAEDTASPNIKVYDGSWAEYSSNPESIIN